MKYEVEDHMYHPGEHVELKGGGILVFSGTVEATFVLAVEETKSTTVDFDLSLDPQAADNFRSLFLTTVGTPPPDTSDGNDIYSPIGTQKVEMKLGHLTVVDRDGDRWWEVGNDAWKMGTRKTDDLEACLTAARLMSDTYTSEHLERLSCFGGPGMGGM